jgi:hypothetical protein
MVALLGAAMAAAACGGAQAPASTETRTCDMSGRWQLDDQTSFAVTDYGGSLVLKERCLDPEGASDDECRERISIAGLGSCSARVVVLTAEGDGERRTYSRRTYVIENRGDGRLEVAVSHCAVDPTAVDPIHDPCPAGERIEDPVAGTIDRP